MSEPQRQVSDLTLEDSPLNQSCTSGEFADLLPATSSYFEAWLENLKPALESDQTPSQPVRLTAAAEPVPGEFRFEGRLEGRFEGTLYIDGYATGFLRSLTGTLIIGESGEVESDIVVATAIIDGILRGDIHATERVELQSHARVFGNIESPALSIHPGAVFEGQCHSLPSPFKPASGDPPDQDNLEANPGHDSLAQSHDLATGPSRAETEEVERSFAAVAVAS